MTLSPLRALAAVLAVVAATAASPAPRLWLDQTPLPAWNNTLLPRVAQRDPELAPGGRCATIVRPPETAEDRLVTGAGWSLFGAYQRYGGTAVVEATEHADGMCRPNDYQAFVFVRGRYAGTLAPGPMLARTNGALVAIRLLDATRIDADFARYTDADPLCCPAATTTVTYEIRTRDGVSRVAPASAVTATKS